MITLTFYFVPPIQLGIYGVGVLTVLSLEQYQIDKKRENFSCQKFQYGCLFRG